MHSSYHSSRVEAAVTTRSVPSQTWPPPCSLFQSVMTGLLQDRVAPSKHSGKTDSSCLVEDLALGTLFFSIEAKQGGLGEGFGSHINLCNCSLTSFIQVHAGRWVCRVVAYATHSTYHPQQAAHATHLYPLFG